MAANFAMTSYCNVIKMKEHISTSHLLGSSNKKYQKYKKIFKRKEPNIAVFVLVCHCVLDPWYGSEERDNSLFVICNE